MDQRLSENLKVIQKAVDLRLKTTIDQAAAAEAASRDAHAAKLQADRDVQHQQFALNRAGISTGNKNRITKRSVAGRGF